MHFSRVFFHKSTLSWCSSPRSVSLRLPLLEKPELAAILALSFPLAKPISFNKFLVLFANMPLLRWNHSYFSQLWTLLYKNCHQIKLFMAVSIKTQVQIPYYSAFIKAFWQSVNSKCAAQCIVRWELSFGMCEVYAFACGFCVCVQFNQITMIQHHLHQRCFENSVITDRIFHSYLTF